MKWLSIDVKGADRRNPQGHWAFTLVEMMISMGLFSLVVIALVYVHIFGLKQDELVESKLGASDQARKDFGLILRDVRSAQTFEIGNYSGAFTPIASGNQQGNALRLGLNAPNYPGTNILYYFDNSSPQNVTLNRMHTGPVVANKVIADHLTNYYGGNVTFCAENYSGVIVTDPLDRRVVHFTLGFKQYQYPLTVIGSDYLYDFYKMEFRVTPHVSPGR